MRSLIEAGIAILIVYIFVKSKQGETPQQAITDLFGTPASAGFTEAPGEASGDSEGGPSNFYGTAPGSNQYSTPRGAGCCGGTSSPPTPTPTLPFRSTSGLIIPKAIVSGLVPVSPRVLTNYNFGGGLS